MLLLLLFLIILISANAFTLSMSKAVRPSEVTNLASNDQVYYFGVGSNMLKEKLINRGLVVNKGKGSKISFNKVEPGIVKNHRLAFNMKGFPPFEPAMAGIIETKPEQESECHGALIQMTREEYEKVWLSEGGGSKKPGYEEVIVDCYPYGSNTPVKAVSLRAAKHVRMNQDASPSQRYMNILLKGAQELGLSNDYIKMLHSIPTEQVNPIIKFLGFHYFFLAGLLFKMKLRQITKAVNWLLWKCYVPSAKPVNPIKRFISQFLTASFLLPGAVLGGVIRIVMKLTGKSTPPMLASMFKKEDATEIISSTNNNSGSVDLKELGKGYGLSARVRKPELQLTGTVTEIETSTSINSNNIRDLGKNYGLSARVRKATSQMVGTSSELHITTISEGTTSTTTNAVDPSLGKGYGFSARVKMPAASTPVVASTSTPVAVVAAAPTTTAVDPSLGKGYGFSARVKMPATSTPVVASTSTPVATAAPTTTAVDPSLGKGYGFSARVKMPATSTPVVATAAAATAPTTTAVDPSLGKGYGFSARVKMPAASASTGPITIVSTPSMVTMKTHGSYGLSARVTKPAGISSDLPITPSDSTPVAPTPTLDVDDVEVQVPKKRRYGFSAGIQKLKSLFA